MAKAQTLKSGLFYCNKKEYAWHIPCCLFLLVFFDQQSDRFNSYLDSHVGIMDLRIFQTGLGSLLIGNHQETAAYPYPLIGGYDEQG